MKRELKTFLFRVWNTIKYPLLSIFLGVFGKIVVDVQNANTLKVLLDLGYWDQIGVVILVLVGGVLGVGGMAGADKVMREKK